MTQPPASPQLHCEHECVCPDYKASHSDDDYDNPEPCTIPCMQQMIRPHTQAPTPAVWRCCEFQSRPTNREPVECLMVKETARTATLAENKRVLDELIDELPNVERSYGGEQIDTYIETHEMKELIDSLRSTAQEQP